MKRFLNHRIVQSRSFKGLLALFLGVLMMFVLLPQQADAHRRSNRRSRLSSNYTQRVQRQTYAQAVSQLPPSARTLYRFKGPCTGNCSVMRSSRPLLNYGVQHTLGRNRYTRNTVRRFNRVSRPVRQGRRIYRRISRRF
jgi:hypothetical protein